MSIFRGKEILLAGLKGEKGDTGGTAPVVQTSGTRTDAVMSQKAVTDFVNQHGGGQGWTEEQIDLLEEAVDEAETAKNDIPFRTTAGATAANAFIAKMRDLIQSLRGGQPEPEPEYEEEAPDENGVLILVSAPQEIDENGVLTLE